MQTQPKPTNPLYPSWVNWALALLANTALLLWLWPASALREWSFQVAITLCTICFLTIYVSGELIRWRLRISLKTLFALITLVSVVCGSFGAWILSAQQQRRRTRAITQLGGYVRRDIRHGLDGKVITQDGWVLPEWLLDTFGADFFARVDEVRFYQTRITDNDLTHLDLHGFRILGLHGDGITDQGVAQLTKYQELRELWLSATRVSDDELQSLQQLPNLETLSLHNTSITDAGLIHLQTLRKLEWIDVRKTKVTEAGIAELQTALPACQIQHDFMAVP